MNEQIFATARSQLEQLRQVVAESEKRLIGENVDLLFYDYQNVFVKSYLVAACSILESFIQELAVEYMETMRSRLAQANIPFNFAHWAADNEKAKSKFGPFHLTKKKSDISDLISPNYYKTITAFSRIGVNLEQSNEIKAFKDYISSIVDKRNKIVHHNDMASDLSFTDVISAIDEFDKYAECMFTTVISDQHLV